MDDWPVAAIVIGVVGAVVGVYFRESVRRATQQKVAAAKLEAYLADWHRHISEGELESFFVAGYSWQKDESDAIKAKGRQGLEEVSEKYKTRLKEAKEAIEREDKDIRDPLEQEYTRIRNMSDSQFSLNMKLLDQTRQMILSNSFFISDDEAAMLSWVCAQRVIPMKSNMHIFIVSLTQLHVTLRNLDVFRLSEVADNFYSLVESGILMAKYYMPLVDHARSFRQQNLWVLTLKNLFQ